MPSLFAGEMADFAAAIGEGLGSAFTWTPMKEAPDVNAAPVADPNRAGGTVQAVFLDKEAKPLTPNGFDPRADQRPGTLTGTPHIDVLPDAVTGMPVDIRRLDLLVSDVGNSWRVASVFPMKSGIRTCYVNAT